MMRILFLVLCSMTAVQFTAQAEIEIYADGHKYSSLQAYKTSEKSDRVDLSKIKTDQLKSMSLAEMAQHKLYVLSVEKTVVGALQGFYQNWGSPDIKEAREISSGQLKDVIQEAVTSSKDPKLLISGAGKVRIMRLQ